MTIGFTDQEVAEIMGAILWSGSAIGLLIVGLFVYLMVRPPRGRDAAPEQDDEIDVAELLALLERMERRLEVLERAVDRKAAPEKEIVEAGGERPQSRRIK